MNIHFDTDLGGDIDDLCALTMLLRWRGDIHINGVTTVAEAEGKRAGYVSFALKLEGRDDIPVAAGADVSQGFYRFAELDYPPEERYWSEKVTPLPTEMNHVIENANPTLIPLTVSVETALRRAYLKDLVNAGKLGQLLAKQAEEFALDEKMEKRFGETCEGLPTDIINFQHDSLACAIALGWNEGVEISEIPIKLTLKDNWLHEKTDYSGKPTKVVTKVNGNRFNEFWIETIANQKGIQPPVSHSATLRGRCRGPLGCAANR